MLQVLHCPSTGWRHLGEALSPRAAANPTQNLSAASGCDSNVLGKKRGHPTCFMTSGCSGSQAGEVMHDVGQAIRLWMVHAEGLQPWEERDVPALQSPAQPQTLCNPLAPAAPSTPSHTGPRGGRETGTADPEMGVAWKGKTTLWNRITHPATGRERPWTLGAQGCCLMPRLVDSAGVGGTCAAEVHPE